LMKTCPLGAELCHAVGWADMTKLIAVFIQFFKPA
jgi:hypothetical protein